MTTIRAAVDAFARSHPEFFVIAGRHRFECTCAHCVCFLALDGLDGLVQPQPNGPDVRRMDPLEANVAFAVQRGWYRDWLALQGELVLGDFASEGLTGQQAERFMAIAGVAL